MKELVDFIKNKCSQEEIAKLVKELSAKEETKENDVPKSWEEYCKNLNQGYYLNSDSEIDFVEYSSTVKNSDYAKNMLPTKELAEAFLAFMQLMSLRQAWIGDWEPDWNDISIPKYGIVFEQYEFQVDIRWSEAHNLSFPTKEMAQDFLDCFRDLIEKAKVLI